MHRRRRCAVRSCFSSGRGWIRHGGESAWPADGPGGRPVDLCAPAQAAHRCGGASRGGLRVLGPLDRPGRCADRPPCCWWCWASGPAVCGCTRLARPGAFVAGCEVAEAVDHLPFALLGAVDVGDPGVKRVVDRCCADAGPALLVGNGAASPRPASAAREKCNCAGVLGQSFRSRCHRWAGAVLRRWLMTLPPSHTPMSGPGGGKVQSRNDDLRVQEQGAPSALAASRSGRLHAGWHCRPLWTICSYMPPWQRRAADAVAIVPA